MSSEYGVTVTLKAGKGYESPWIVLHSPTLEDAEQKLDAIHNLAQKTTSAAKAFQVLQEAEQGGLGVAQVQVQPAQQASAPVPQQPTQPPGWAQPAPQPQAPAAPQQQAVVYHPEGLLCPADNLPVQYKSIFSEAKNKTFNLWVCPNQRSKDDGHFSQFAN